MKYLYILLPIIVACVLWIGYTNNLDQQRMQVEYCWDSAGNHYVAPSPYCR